MKGTWQTKPLGDVCKTSAGGTPLKSKREFYAGGTIPWLLSGEVNQREITSTANFITEAGLKNSSAKLFPRNSVLIAMYGATAGQVGVLRIEATTNQAVCGILPSEKFIPDFLFYFFLFKKDELVAQAAGNAQPNSSQLKIRNMEVPLASRDEQQRIAAILDEAFDGIATAKANAEKNLQNASELFRRHLQNVFTTRADDWLHISLGEVCKFVRGPFGGSLKKSIFVSEGNAVYEQQHAIYDQFDDVRYFVDDAKFLEMKRFELRPNDIIMSCSGTMGRVAIVPEGITRGIINQALLKLTPSSRIKNTFLKFYMESEAFQDAVKEYSGGAAIQNVASVKILKEIKVPLPTVNVQDRVVKELDSVMQKALRLESLYQKKLAALDELKKSLLHEAFSGRL